MRRLATGTGAALLAAMCSAAFAQNATQNATAQSAPAQPQAVTQSAQPVVAAPSNAPVAPTPLSPCRPRGQAYQPMDEKMPCPPDSALAQPKTYIVPAGTKVLLQLRNSINTKSAQPGDGVYLASTFPVVVGNRVLIPVGVYVQGVVDRVQRAGRVHGKAQLDMHFTTIVFPNGSVVEIPGIVNSVPGASKQSVKKDGEGTIEQDSDKTRNMGKVAEVAIPTGGAVGAISGAADGHAIAGGVAGIAAGVATAGIVSLFTRGADVNIPAGTQVEMVLQRPLVLQESNLPGAPGPATALTPAPNQSQPMAKPVPAPKILCPFGSLGCE